MSRRRSQWPKPAAHWATIHHDNKNLLIHDPAAAGSPEVEVTTVTVTP